MAESYYSSTQPSAAAPQISQSPISAAGPPPPPPPKPSSHDPSRSGTPSNSYRPQSFHEQMYTRDGPPPPPIPPSPSHAQALAMQQQRQHQQQYSSSAPDQSGKPAPVQPPPLNSGWLPDGLAAKMTTDLQPLLNDPELLTALAHTHPSYQSSLEPLQNAIAANMSLAQQVAQLEDQVKKLREQTGQLLINHASLYTQWKRKEGDMNNALSPWESRAMYQRLASSIADQESLLRAVHESFIDGGDSNDYSGRNNKASEKEVTEWVKRIREGTTILEKRREMRARWDEGRVGGLR